MAEGRRAWPLPCTPVEVARGLEDRTTSMGTRVLKVWLGVLAVVCALLTYLCWTLYMEVQNFAVERALRDAKHAMMLAHQKAELYHARAEAEAELRRLKAEARKDAPHDAGPESEGFCGGCPGSGLRGCALNCDE